MARTLLGSPKQAPCEDLGHMDYRGLVRHERIRPARRGSSLLPVLALTSGPISKGAACELLTFGETQMLGNSIAE